MLITAEALAPRLVERMKLANPIFGGLRAAFDFVGADAGAHEVVGLLVAKTLSPARADFLRAAYDARMAEPEAWADAERDRLVDLVMAELTGIAAFGHEVEAA